MPLFHTNFFPDLIQVYFLPWYVFVVPCFEQTDPAFGGVAECAGIRDRSRTPVNPRIHFFMDGRIDDFGAELSRAG